MHATDLPNLFIIGAPKCGTTSTFRWLSEHPEICASKPKETWFFAGPEIDLLKVRPNCRDNELSDYLRYFGPVDERTRIRMDGSTHYLYSEAALTFLSGFSPQPRILVHLRNPAARIWSHFNYIKQDAPVPISLAFADYVSTLIDDSGSFVPRYTDDAWSQHLLENQLNYSDYGHHLRGWTDAFPPDCIRILILENLAGQSRRMMQDIAEWLNVDPEFYANRTLRVSNVTLARGAARVQHRLRRIGRIFPRSMTSVVGQIINRKLGAFRKSRSPEDQAALERLQEYFDGPNRRLQNDFGLDLSRWSR